MERISALALLLVPPKDERIQLTPANSGLILCAPWLPVALAAYLSRKRNCWALRMSLACIAPLLIIPLAYGIEASIPNRRFVWVQGMTGCSCLVRTLELCFASPGRLRVGEKTLPPSTSWRDALDLLLSPRGYGWDFGTGTGLVSPFKVPIDRAQFIRTTFIRAVSSYFFFDFLASLVLLAPATSAGLGSTIFIEGVPPAQRYLLSTLFTLGTGVGASLCLSMLYDLLVLFSVCVLDQPFFEWPPLFDAPWLATSLHDFWARRWHQVFRSTFLHLGGYPLEWLGLGRAGRVVGAFLASGFAHDLGIWAIDREVHYQAMVFFTLQGLGVVAERVFLKLTGRKVGGWPGRVWAYIVILGAAQRMIDLWHRSGVFGGTIWPSHISFAQSFLFPSIRGYFNLGES
ncbi:membrane bound O-acyl transferase family-domain-containing protein [Auriculariales sp. MPI-PUGE-AT-0066]|nr:membrane bound O-acyl transferase family-domain-containing protein [Auriculariales sp. MPI-PUGE-AT-0066]